MTGDANGWELVFSVCVCVCVCVCACVRTACSRRSSAWVSTIAESESETCRGLRVNEGRTDAIDVYV